MLEECVFMKYGFTQVSCFQSNWAIITFIVYWFYDKALKMLV